jgi:hypothetical protein
MLGWPRIRGERAYYYRIPLSCPASNGGPVPNEAEQNDMHYQHQLHMPKMSRAQSAAFSPRWLRTLAAMAVCGTLSTR